MNKKIVLASAGVLVVLIAVSYGVVGGALQPFLTPVDNDNIPDLEIDTAPIDAADSDAAFAFDAIANATIPADIAEANNAFAVDFYKQVDTDGENIFFSPTSMYTAFSVLYEGARYNTAEQIQQVFGINPDRQARHNAAAHMISSLNQDDPHATLELANSLWIADWFNPHDAYLDVARNTYLANAEKIDFVGEGVDRINDWASDKTHGKIPKVLIDDDVDGETAMAILNAIYFKGTWETQFSEEDTSESKFYTDSDRSVDADFMNVHGTFDYTYADGAKILKLPYNGDRLSMLVILPEDKDGMEQLRENISPELVQKWQQNLLTSDVIVSIPKFEVKTHYDLKGILMEMGIRDAFAANADLLGILGIQPGEEYYGADLYVKKAIHDAYVKINEEGTEAAAVTTILVTTESEGPRPIEFIADHPFVFLIQDDASGAILFMGAINDPTGQNQPQTRTTRNADILQSQNHA